MGIWDLLDQSSLFEGRIMYLVQEVLWEVEMEVLQPIWEIDDQQVLTPDFVTFRCPNPGQGRPVKLFASKRNAEQFRTEREAKAQQARNPFLHGEDLADLTSMPSGVFLDWLTDAEIQSPSVSPFNPTTWFHWWQGDDLTEEQRARIWQVLDKVRFFTVVRLEAPQS